MQGEPYQTIEFVASLLIVRERGCLVGVHRIALEKALGALKDTTTVSLVKVNIDYKVL